MLRIIEADGRQIESVSVVFFKVTKITIFFQKNYQNYLTEAWDITLAPEPRIFSMPKTFELTNIPGTVS